MIRRPISPAVPVKQGSQDYLVYIIVRTEKVYTYYYLENKSHQLLYEAATTLTVVGVAQFNHSSHCECAVNVSDQTQAGQTSCT